MDEATARARLEAMVDASSAILPLSSPLVDQLLAMSKRMDKYGAWPTDSDWVGTYDLNAAAAEAWRWKAAQAASAVSFSADGASFDRNALIAHCESMVKLFQRRVHASVAVDGSTTLLGALDAVSLARDAPYLGDDSSTLPEG